MLFRDRPATNESLRQVVTAAGRAPTADDSQPWRWRVSNGLLDLFADYQPTPAATDPVRRRAVISCGAALHHARLTLAAQGWRVTVTRRPDDVDPSHLARLHIDGSAPVSPDTARLARAIGQRAPDAPSASGVPLDPAHLRAVVTAFEAQRVSAAILASDRIGSGEPDGTFAVLHGPHDRDLDWLHAGEALSAGSLVAAGLGVSVRPLGHDQQEALRPTVPGRPYLAIRLSARPTGTVTALDRG
ncbi:hypothetical protein JCM9534A_34870 [Catenuloplanes indicus JCM 9534]